MEKKAFRFGSAMVDYYLHGKITGLKNIVAPASTIIITDEHVFLHHQKHLKGWNTIVLKSGEEYKTQPTVDAIIGQLIAMGADRSWMLIGVGGGVVTDLTGYVASIYMRGIAFGFVPTTLLAMVDAAIGGKNGIDVGIYKNMVGTVNQPRFILWDTAWLQTLPQDEWTNGFAEIIKHACIKDKALFFDLEKWDITHYQKSKKELLSLIQRNVLLKTKVVQKDQFEKGDRKLLNFGHTLGHALENQYELSHGQAISLGMSFATRLSAQLLGFKDADKVDQLLSQYGLITNARYNAGKVFRALQKDKKKQRDMMHFILLEKLGTAVVQPLQLTLLKESL